MSKSLLLLLAALVVGCTSGPKKELPTLAEQITEDSGLGVALSQKFEPTFALRNEPQLSVYVRKIALKLMEGTKAFKSVGVGVFLIDNKEATWRSYGLPGVRIYFSANLFKRMAFENEVAAALALELGHIMSRHIATKIQGDRIPESVFQYSDAEVEEALRAAVTIMYQGGYDPRGLVPLWAIFQRFPRYSPLALEFVDKLRNQTYARIAELAPLRNPIIQTEDFTLLKPRIQGL